MIGLSPALHAQNMQKKDLDKTLKTLIDGSTNNFTTIKGNLPFFGFGENLINYDARNGNYFFARKYFTTNEDARKELTAIKELMNTCLNGKAIFTKDNFKSDAFFWTIQNLKAKDKSLKYKLEFDISLNGYSQPYIWVFVRRFPDDGSITGAIVKPEIIQPTSEPTAGLATIINTETPSDDEVTSGVPIIKLWHGKDVFVTEALDETYIFWQYDGLKKLGKATNENELKDLLKKYSVPDLYENKFIQYNSSDIRVTIDNKDIYSGYVPETAKETHYNPLTNKGFSRTYKNDNTVYYAFEGGKKKDKPDKIKMKGKVADMFAFSCVYSPDDRYLVSLRYGSAFDLKEEKLVWKNKFEDDFFYDARTNYTFSTDNKQIAVATAKAIKIIDLKTGNLIKEITNFPAELADKKYLPYPCPNMKDYIYAPCLNWDQRSFTYEAFQHAWLVNESGSTTHITDPSEETERIAWVKKMKIKDDNEITYQQKKKERNASIDPTINKEADALKEYEKVHNNVEKRMKQIEPDAIKWYGLDKSQHLFYLKLGEKVENTKRSIISDIDALLSKYESLLPEDLVKHIKNDYNNVKNMDTGIVTEEAED